MTPATEAKAARILASGALKVVYLVGTEIIATCRSMSGAALYTLGSNAGGWHCSCPARRECAHLRALKLVAVINLRAAA